MKVTFACPVCEYPARLTLDHVCDWQCARCDQRRTMPVPAADLPACVVCGNHELYRKKDFPHWLGMTILVSACVLSTVTYYWYEKWWTWLFLIGSAALDGIMYLMVGDAIVCYRCQAHYRGAAANDAHPPFELTIGERHRQDRLRQERMTRDNPRTK